MSYLLHNGVVVFLAFASIMALGAWAIGRALAGTWRPFWHAVPYAALLAFFGRVIFWGLSGGNNAQFFPGLDQVYVDFAVLIGIAATAFRLTRARRMVTQYSWLYESVGPFSWRERRSGGSEKR